MTDEDFFSEDSYEFEFEEEDQECLVGDTNTTNDKSQGLVRNLLKMF